MNITQIAKRMEKFTLDNSPAILTAIGVTGTLTTAYLTGKATFKAAELIEEEKARLNLREKLDNADPKAFELEPKDKVALVWREYVPAASMAIVTSACIISANRIGTRRAAALATAYSVSERAFVEYKDKVIEKFGEKKEQQVRDEIAQDRVNRQPASQQVIIVGNGDVLFRDAFSGRYFNSSVEKVQRAENDTNYQVLHQGYASLSDFYERVGLPATSASEEVGWNNDKMLEVERSVTVSEDGRPCISIDFFVAPIRGYNRLI